MKQDPSPVRLMAFLKPYWVPALLAPLLMVLEVVMDLAQPRYLEHIVDLGIGQGRMDVVLQTGLLMVALALAGALAGAGNMVLAVRVSQGMGADVRSALFRNVQSLSFADLDRLKTGGLITRLTNDVTQVQELVLVSLRIMIRAPLTVVGSLVMAVITSARLALLLLAVIPFLTGVTLVVVRRTRVMFREVQRGLDGINTVMQENLAGVRVIKAFVRAPHEVARFREANERLTERTSRTMQLMAVVMPVMMLAMNLGIVGAVWLGGVQAAAGRGTVGELVAFVNYLLRSLMSLMMVGLLLARVSRAQASADRIRELLAASPSLSDRPDALAQLQPRGRPSLRSVSFSYDGGLADPVLRGVDFTAEAGQTIVILGATGSGKSTLVHLLPRYYDASSGQVCLDGIDVRDIRQQALRRAIGSSLQQPILFSGTVRDNIRYGRPEAAEEDLLRAARAAQAHEFISRLPQGYDTVIGQRGVDLSGGQRQRIAIARALLAEPSVLILDDCTSAVDVDTEARIQEALATVRRGRTTLLVAQRISAAILADRVLVLERGRIVADGTHRQLLASSPIYREIYDSQLGGSGAAGAGGTESEGRS